MVEFIRDITFINQSHSLRTLRHKPQVHIWKILRNMWPSKGIGNRIKGGALAVQSPAFCWVLSCDWWRSTGFPLSFWYRYPCLIRSASLLFYLNERPGSLDRQPLISVFGSVTLYILPASRLFLTPIPRAGWTLLSLWHPHCPPGTPYEWGWRGQSQALRSNILNVSLSPPFACRFPSFRDSSFAVHWWCRRLWERDRFWTSSCWSWTSPSFQ